MTTGDFKLPPVVGGVPHTIDNNDGLSRVAVARQSLPTGKSVSSEFPWWRTGRLVLPAIPQVINHIDVAAGVLESTFKNDTPFDVSIDKITFNLNLSGSDDARDTLVQIDTDNYQIIKLWMPVTTLHTEEDRYVVGPQHGQTFRLPSPYYLIAPAIIRLAVFNSGAGNLTGVHIIVSLHGYNPTDRDPIVMTKVATLGAAGVYSWLSFDENRDGSLRDMVIEKITFGVDNYYNSSSTMDNFWQQLRVRFDPPEGPKWSIDQGTPIFNLFEQMQCATPGAETPVVYHRPITPYVLHPMQTMNIKAYIWNVNPGVAIQATAIGRQKGGRV